MNITSIFLTEHLVFEDISPEGPDSSGGRAMFAWGGLRCIRCGYDYCGCWR